MFAKCLDTVFKIIRYQQVTFVWGSSWPSGIGPYLSRNAVEFTLPNCNHLRVHIWSKTAIKSCTPWRGHSFGLKAEHFPIFAVTRVSSETSGLTKVSLETILAIRNLAYIAWSFGKWAPVLTWVNTSNTMNIFDNSESFPRIPYFPQTSVSASTSSVEGPELRSLLPPLGPKYLLSWQLAGHHMKLIYVLRFLPEGLVIGNMSSLS